MPLSPTPLENLARAIGHALQNNQEWLSVAESCTGGWVAQTLTAIAGSSNWFDRGFVTYSNNAKQTMLGVPENTLVRHGAVSEATARAMAQGAITQSGTDWSLSITGIAGPGGGSPEKPVGMVCFAWAQKNGGCEATTHYFDGDRTAIRAQAVEFALRGLLARIEASTATA